MFPKICLAVLLAVPAFALPPGLYPFRSYGAEAGLGNLSAMKLAQDEAGFLWVATQDGVYRYDGTRFTRFGLEEGLPSTFVTTLKPRRGGGVWAGTFGGVAEFDGRRFVAARLPKAAPNAIAVDARGRLWAAMPQGLFVDGQPVFAEEATAVWADGDDIWVAQAGAHARRIGRLRGGQWTWWALDDRIGGIVVDRERRVWARSASRLWSMGANESAFRDETAALPATSNDGYLALDARGNLWVPTDRGLAIHSDGGWRILGAREGLPTEWARDVLEDREGSIWVASLGVHRMLGRGELTSFKRANGLPNDVVWTFARDAEGRLLVGTDLGLARAEASGWSVVPGTERLQVRSLIVDGGTIWAAGNPASVLRIERGVQTETLPGRAVTRLMHDRDGAIWAATRGGGLLRRTPDAARFERVAIPNGTPEEDFRDVMQDSRGRVWATGQFGLACLANGAWRRYGAKDGLAGDHVSYIVERKSGELVVAYFEPLGAARIRVDGSLRVLERLDATNKLAASKVFLVGEDAHERLWIGTGIGVDVIDGSSVEHYGSADGLAGDDTDALAFLCDANGDVFIGTSSGFSHYVRRADRPSFAPPPVMLTAATIGAHAIGGAPLEVDRTQRDFAATFSALSYFKPDIVEYEARLLGIDENWVRLAEPRAQWRSLPPGEYRFEVRARLRPGRWSAPAAVAFTIRPPWWQTPWARALAAALLALLIWLAHRTRVALLRRRNRELQALVEQRTRELAELSVTDALTGARNRRYVDEFMARHDGAPMLFLLIDLDRFKEVNDRHGHVAGDAVLVALRRLMSTLMRSDDALVRWGGEEFLLISRGRSSREGAMLAEAIRAAIEAHEFATPAGESLRLTCSIGFAPFPFEAMRWQDLIDAADGCLYAAKAEGRNYWVGLAPAGEVELHEPHGHTVAGALGGAGRGGGRADAPHAAAG